MPQSPIDEFGFIAKYLSGLAGPEGLDLKDDIAVWRPSKGLDAVISMDTLVEGVHFPDLKFDAQLAEKLIGVNVSDLVAKGADPVGYFLSLTLSEDVDEGALADFCRGLAKVQNAYGLKLWGGDTSRAKHKNVLTVTIMGTVPTGKAVLRSSAKPGELICVTGTIGDSYLGLKSLLNQADSSDDQSEFWRRAYHLPAPPFSMRKAIRKYAAASIDISDGLLADAGHIARASRVGMDIFLTTIPLSTASTRWVLGETNHQQARLALASGGDDYQVLLCVSERNLPKVKRQANNNGIALTIIGKVTDGEGVTCQDSQGNAIDVEKPGYAHF